VVIHKGNHLGCERRVYVTSLITSYLRAYSFYLSCWTTTIQRLNNTTKRLRFKTLPANLHFLQIYTACRSTLPPYLHCLQSYTASISTLSADLHCLHIYTACRATLPADLHCSQIYAACRCTLLSQCSKSHIYITKTVSHRINLVSSIKSS
jgi:hypothetical protein